MERERESERECGGGGNSKFIAPKPVDICRCQHTFKRQNQNAAVVKTKEARKTIYQSREWSWLRNTLCELRRATEQKG